MRLALAGLLACLLGAALGGCSTLTAQRKGDPTGSAAEALRGAPLVDLVVEAPDPLKALLANNLDLGRLTRLAGDEPVSETEIARLVGAAPAQARELLETEGYFDPVVSVKREPGAAPARVVVSVQPGPRVRVSELDFRLHGELEQRAAAGDAQARTTIAALRRAWLLPLGSPFRNPLWSDAKSAALAQLRAEGYASATLSGSSAQVDAVEGSAHLSVTAESGPLFHVGDLVVEGLERQEESSVRNLAGFSRGQPLTDQMLLDFQERLQTAALFDRASVTMDPDPQQAAAARITVRVHELSLQQATAGVGYSTIAGPRASLEHWHRRLFGQPVISRTKVEWGRDRQLLEGDLSSHAKADFWHNLVGYSVERDKTDADTVTTESLRVGRAQDTLHLQRRYYVEGLNSVRTTADTREQGSALWGNYQWSWRELDSIVLPTDGFTLSLEAGGGRAHDHLNRAGGFGRFYARATGYKPFGRDWFGNARLELGQVLTSNNVEVPDTLRFRAGGDESVRGYAYRTLAPLDATGAVTGGKVLFTSSFELARPVSPKLPSVWWAVFFDAGRAADNFSELHPAYGYGAGIRWRSPVGPLKLDLAYGNETRKVRLHLSVGIAF